MNEYVIDIEEIVAEYFTNYDRGRAWEMLNRQKILYRRTDIALLTFFGGGSLIIFLIILYNFIVH